MQLRNLTVANVEEFTTDYIYDPARDTILLTIDEVYTKAIMSTLFQMDYCLLLRHYDPNKDSVTLVFTR